MNAWRWLFVFQTHALSLIALEQLVNNTWIINCHDMYWEGWIFTMSLCRKLFYFHLTVNILLSLKALNITTIFTYGTGPCCWRNPKKPLRKPKQDSTTSAFAICGLISSLLKTSHFSIESLSCSISIFVGSLTCEIDHRELVMIWRFSSNQIGIFVHP